MFEFDSIKYSAFISLSYPICITLHFSTLKSICMPFLRPWNKVTQIRLYSNIFIRSNFVINLSIICKFQNFTAHRFIDREFEFYEFFSFFNEFYEFFFRLKKIRKKFVILQILDVQPVSMFWNVSSFIYTAFIRTTDRYKVQTAFVSLFYIFINMKPWNASNSSVVVEGHAHSGI